MLLAANGRTKFHILGWIQRQINEEGKTTSFKLNVCSAFRRSLVHCEYKYRGAPNTT